MSLLIIGAIYHPPDARNGPMIGHIQVSLEAMLQKHPHAGIILAGDFNQLKTSAICSGFGLKQIVKCATRARNTLDKIMTNLADYYQNAVTIGSIGNSDHEAVLARPSLPPHWEPPKKVTILTRRASHNCKMEIAEALQSVPWDAMYLLPTCQQQFDFFPWCHQGHPGHFVAPQI